MLDRSHQAEIIIVKRLIQARNNVTKVRVEPRSCDQVLRANEAVVKLSNLFVLFIHCKTMSYIETKLTLKLSAGYHKTDTVILY